MINSIDKVPQCPALIKSYIGATLGLGLEQIVQKGVGFFDIDNEESFSDILYLCRHHKEMVASLISSYPLLSAVCPDIPVSFNSLGTILSPVVLSAMNGERELPNIVVSRERAFSDWLQQVAPYRRRFFPRRVNWSNEPGEDAGGLSRDWITRVADIVSSPTTCDPAGGLFQLDDRTREYLVFSLTKTAAAVEGQLWTEWKHEYYQFGRFLAIVLMKREQLGIPLPVFFFSKLLYGMIRPADLRSIDTERSQVLRKLIEHVQANNFSQDAPFEIEFPELPGEELKLTKDNVKEEITKVLDAIYMPGRANEAMDEIRRGLSEIISIEGIRNKLTPFMFRNYVVGDESLDVDELKKLAARRLEQIEAPRISDKVFDMLFQWLTSNPKLHRQFMIFSTGSSSLRPRQLLITGPDSTSQGRVPKAHTCFNWLALPEYADYAELNGMLSEAIFHTQMGMN